MSTSSPEGHFDTRQQSDQDLPLPETNEQAPPNPTSVGPGKLSRTALFGATGLAAVAGVGYESAQADAAPAPQNTPTHVRSVGDQQISTGDFLKTARVSASELLKLSPKNSNQINKAETKPDKAADFTVGLFNKIKEGKLSPLVALNGVAVLKDSAPIYYLIDPTLGPGHRLAKGDNPADVGIYGYGKGKVLPMKRPWVQWDGQRWWVCASNLSSGNYRTERLADANHQMQPMNQATDFNEIRCTPYDPDQVQMYLYTDSLNAPKGVQPFVGMKANIPKPNTNQGWYADNGLFNNFSSTSWNIRSTDLFGWLTNHYSGQKDGLYNDQDVTDGGMYMTQKQMNFYTSSFQMKPYKLTGSHTELVKTMLKDAQPKVYTGGD